MTDHAIYIHFYVTWNIRAHTSQFLLKHVKFLVDRFHVSKHTEPCCKPPSSDNPQCHYRPDHADFCAVKDANMECAEDF